MIKVYQFRGDEGAMKLKNSQYFKWGLTAIIVVCSSILFYYIVFHGEHLKNNISIFFRVMSPILYGMVIAYLLTPIQNFIQYRLLEPIVNKLKWKSSAKRKGILRGISILFTLIFFVGLISILLSIFISEIIPSIINISQNTDAYIDTVSVWINEMLDGNPAFRDYAIKTVEKYSLELENFVNVTLIQKSTELVKTVSLSIISVFSVFWNFILGFIISVYLLAGKEKFTGDAKRVIYAMFQEKTANTILNNFKFAHKAFSGFISGKVVDSLIIGVLCFIGTSILRTPYALLVSVLIGITNIIPFFGPFIGAIPSCILILLVDPMHPMNVVYFILFILILQQIDGNIIGPKILGNSTGLTGFWVIFAITVFGGFLGLIGIIAGVPLFAVVYAALKSYIDTRLSRKQLCTDGSAYTNVNGIKNGEYSTFTPEYMLSKKKQKQNLEKPDNLFKEYGNKYICDINQETSVEETLNQSDEKDYDVKTTSTVEIITDNEVKNQ